MWLIISHPLLFELICKIARLSYSAGLLTLKLLERKSLIPLSRTWLFLDHMREILASPIEVVTYPS